MLNPKQVRTDLTYHFEGQALDSLLICKSGAGALGIVAKDCCGFEVTIWLSLKEFRAELAREAEKHPDILPPIKTGSNLADLSSKVLADELARRMALDALGDE